MPAKKLRLKKQTVRVTPKEDSYASRVARAMTKKFGAKVSKEEMYRHAAAKLGIYYGLKTPTE